MLSIPAKAGLIVAALLASTMSLFVLTNFHPMSFRRDVTSASTSSVVSSQCENLPVNLASPPSPVYHINKHGSQCCTDRVKVLLIHAGDAPDGSWETAFGSAWKWLKSTALHPTCVHLSELGLGEGQGVSDELVSAVLAADIVMVKSNWGWWLDRALRPVFQAAEASPNCAVPAGRAFASAVKPSRCGPTRVLLLSGTSDPIEPEDYDVVAYEVHIYQEKLKDLPHPAVHAFGIDVDALKPRSTDHVRPFDWFWVGQMGSYKRPLLLLDMPGTKLVVTTTPLTNPLDPSILSALQSDPNVTALGPQEYHSLAALMQASKSAYATMPSDGGGERFVLEARSAGMQVHVAEDNHKLLQLACGPLYDKVYYATQLLAAVQQSGFLVFDHMCLADAKALGNSDLVSLVQA